MFILLAVVAVFCAVHTSPLPRPHVTDERVVYEPLQEPYATPSGLPWQAVLAPYMQRPSPVSSWDRGERR